MAGSFTFYVNGVAVQRPVFCCAKAMLIVNLVFVRCKVLSKHLLICLFANIYRKSNKKAAVFIGILSKPFPANLHLLIVKYKPGTRIARDYPAYRKLLSFTLQLRFQLNILIKKPVNVLYSLHRKYILIPFYF